MRVCVVASHSGGHILPAVAFCQGLKDKYCNVDIKFITTDGNIEKQILGKYFDVIFFKKKSINLLTSYNLLILFFKAQSLINKLKPDLVVGFGGYLSVPFIISASLFKIPNFIHEQNVRLGLANWFLLRFTDKIILSFPNTNINECIRNKSLYLGLPLRKELIKIKKEEARRYFGLDEKCFTILVMGGSQGSYKINKNMVEVLRDKNISGVQIIHLIGSFEYEHFVKEYSNLDIKYKLFKFLDRMEYAFGAADLVVSRAGANTIAEFIAMQLPSILIPYPYAKLHQYDNARFLVDREAAVLIEDKILDKATLRDMILNFKNHPERLSRISENLSKINIPDARNKMADLTQELKNENN